MDDINELIAKLTLNYRVKLIEDVLDEYMNHDKKMHDYFIECSKEKNINFDEYPKYTKTEHRDIIKYIIIKFREFIFVDIIEPYYDIHNMSDEMAKHHRGKIKMTFLGEPDTHMAHDDGRPYKEEEDIDDDDFRYLDMVYVHTLYETKENLVSYNTTTNFKNVTGKKRIFKPIEKTGWRDMAAYEIEAYINIIKTKRNENTKKIAGTNGGMIAKISVEKDKEVFRISIDNNKGAICENKYKNDIIDILIQENITAAEVKNIKVTNEMIGGESDKTLKLNMIEYLIECKHFKPGQDTSNFSNKQLQNICKWYISKMGRDKMCAILKQHFIDTGRFVRI